jgi:hypothetical protein
LPVTATSPKYTPASEKELGRDTVGTQRLGLLDCKKPKIMHSTEFKRKRCIDVTGCKGLNFAALLPSFFAQDSLSSNLYTPKILMRFAQQQEGRKRNIRMLRMSTSRDSTPSSIFSAVRFLGPCIHSK